MKIPNIKFIDYLNKSGAFSSLFHFIPDEENFIRMINIIAKFLEEDLKKQCLAEMKQASSQQECFLIGNRYIRQHFRSVGYEDVYLDYDQNRGEYNIVICYEHFMKYDCYILDYMLMYRTISTPAERFVWTFYSYVSERLKLFPDITERHEAFEISLTDLEQQVDVFDSGEGGVYGLDENDHENNLKVLKHAKHVIETVEEKAKEYLKYSSLEYLEKFAKSLRLQMPKYSRRIRKLVLMARTIEKMQGMPLNLLDYNAMYEYYNEECRHWSFRFGWAYYEEWFMDEMDQLLNEVFGNIYVMPVAIMYSIGKDTSTLPIRNDGVQLGLRILDSFTDFLCTDIANSDNQEKLNL